MKSLFTKIILVLFLSFGSGQLFAQLNLPRLSPNASVSQTVGYTKITVNYCRPGVKERTIWGGLVPYDKVWRTGANEATTIEFTTDVTIAGKKVPGGIYSLFTIPAKDEWTVILNKTDKQWGAFNYDMKQDFMRFKVKPSKADFVERMLFTFKDVTDNSTTLTLSWAGLSVSFDINVDVIDQVHAKIKDALASAKQDDWQTYASAANYAADNNAFLDEALQWIDKAIKIDGNFYPYFVRAKVYYAKGKYVDALKSIENCRDAGRSSKDYDSYISQVDYLEKQIKEKM